MLLAHFQRSAQPANDTVLYGDESNPAIELTYSEAGLPISMRPGPAFRDEDRVALTQIIHDSILTLGPVKIGRVVMFAALPVVGWYRFRDEFQIVPVPPEAPRPPQIIGDHPFLMEVAYRSNATHGVNSLRLQKRARELELLCGLLLWPNIFSGPSTVLFHWVLDSVEEGKHVSAFKQGGYFFSGGATQSDGFSEVGGLPPLEVIDVQKYYVQLGIAVGQTLSIPSSFTDSLNIVHALSDDSRKRFIRACFWYQKSLKAWQLSRSIAFEALVCAIEALMPSPKQGESCPECKRNIGTGPTKLFADFVDQFARGVPEKDRRKFYSLRSAISHGGKLLHSDEMAWGFGLQLANEIQNLQFLSSIVRIALFNWLHAQPV